MIGPVDDPDFDRADRDYRQGHRADAAATLRALLARRPDHPPALHLLGVLALEDGAPAAALGHFERAIAARSDYAEAHMNRGHALLDMSRTDEALAALRLAIRLRPDLAAAHNSLGLAFQQLGNWRAAAGAHERAIAQQADYAEAWTNLGNALHKLGQADRAIAAHRQAIALRPDFGLAYANLATALRHAGEIQEAIAAYRAALDRQPALVAVYHDLGSTLRVAGRPAEALGVFERGRARAPNDATLLYSLGATLVELDRLDEACDVLRQSLALDPANPAAHYALGNALRDLGAAPDAVAAFRAAVAADPAFANAWSNLLFTLNFVAGETDRSLADANRAWATTLPRPPAPAPPTNDRNPDRRLRIGYVSSEFRQHHFLSEFLPVLRAHDRARVQVTCYADVAAPDAETHGIAALADGFRNLHGLDPAAQAAAIRADGIDILISLTGYLARDRVLFARRIAPLQATYINHLTPTGLDTIDYRLTDEWVDPPGARPESDTETPVHLASGFSTYAPPEDAPPPDDPPVLRNGFATFGSFNNLLKVTDDTLALWAELLRRVANARLLIKARDLSRPDIARAFDARLLAHGIDRARCALVGHVADRRDNLLSYQAVDIGLDPVPFSGGATTREMLWMGLPLVTLAGQTRVSRLGASLLRRAGLAALVADNAADYVRLAAELAVDVPRLAALRAGQRKRLAASSFTDGRRHAADLEAAYREMWRRWCARPRG